MNVDGTPVKAPQATRRKDTVPVLQQSLPPPREGTKSPSEEIAMEVEDQEYCSCGMEYAGEHRWTARVRAVFARMEQYLDRSESLEVDIEELEDFPSAGIEFLVVSAARDECLRYKTNHQIYERKAREGFGFDGTKEKLMSEAPEDLRKQMFQEIKGVDEKIPGVEMERLERWRVVE